MPGYYISDVGDMIRTYVSAASEDEADLEKLIVRPAFLQAIKNGYLQHMGAYLTNFEKEHFYK